MTTRSNADGHALRAPGADRAPRAVDGAPGAPQYTRDALMTAARKLAPRIRACSDEIERARTLPEPLVQSLADLGLYRMFLPRSLGGGECDPLTYFDVVEELARADSAVGWSVLISTSSMTGTVRAFADSVLRSLFDSPRKMANAVEAVGLMYAAAGATAIYAQSRLDRCLRDAHTAAAHVWVAPDTYELAGRLLLGLDPGSPTI